MSGDEQRDEIRKATGFAHIDGEVEMKVCVTENYGHGDVRKSAGTYTFPASAQEIAEQQMQNTNPYPGLDKVADFPVVVKDRTKARFDLLPQGPLWAMAEVMTNGATKPGRVAHNWRKGTNWSDYYSAMMRHASLYQQGEDFEIDPDTGAKTYHLASVMCCAAILLEYSMFNIGTDDRFPAGHPAYKGGKK